MRRACIDCGRPANGTRCPGCFRRHQQRRGPSGYVRQKTNQQILENAMYMCAKCGGRGSIVDHIRPLWQGGRDDPSNKQVLCTACHDRKTAAEARMRLGGRRR